jgi:hypothetical protein
MSSPAKNSNNFFDDKKPPLSTQTSTPAAKKSMIFDDFDESHKQFDSKPVSNIGFKQSPSQTLKPGKSLVDDLFGINKIDEPSVNNSFEFKLNDKYINMSQQDKANENDDFQFGGYVPSSINQPKTTLSSRRNVAFPDDLFTEDIFSTLPTKSSKQQNQQQSKQQETSNNNLLKSMPAALSSQSSKTDDWLGGKSLDIKLENNNSKSKDIDFDFNNKPIRPPISKSSSQQKDSSMNSSFAESVTDNNLDMPYKNNLANISLSSLNNIQPLKFDNNNKDNSKDGLTITAPNLNTANETEDGWLNNLISNKKSSSKPQPKPEAISNVNKKLLFDLKPILLH